MCAVKLDLRNGPQWSIDFPCKTHAKWCPPVDFVRVQQFSDLMLLPHIICDVLLKQVYELQRSTAQLGQGCLTKVTLLNLFCSLSYKHSLGARSK